MAVVFDLGNGREIRATSTPVVRLLILSALAQATDLRTAALLVRSPAVAGEVLAALLRAEGEPVAAAAPNSSTAPLPDLTELASLLGVVVPTEKG